jgi:tetrahydrodipicolinate N-succinyltransferase
MTQQLQTIIETAWDQRATLSPASAPKETLDAVDHVISQLNTGKLRVATRSLPVLSWLITWSTASRVSLGAEAGDKVAR